MNDCAAPQYAASTAYKQYRCRCDRCRAWKGEAMRDYDKRRRAHRSPLTRKNPPGRRRDNDGIVDWVVVERLLLGTATLEDATFDEAVEAARRGYGRDGWYAWCAEELGLRSARIKAIADDVRAGRDFRKAPDADTQRGAA